MKINEISFRRTLSTAGTLFIYLGKKLPFDPHW